MSLRAEWSEFTAEDVQVVFGLTPGVASPRHQVQIAGNGQTYIRVANCQTVRMKEEKEVLEHFAGVFTMMNPLTFKEIFQTTVPYMVERISKNYALQVYTAFCCRRFVFSLFVLND